MDKEKSWGKELAICWTRMVGPSRPTISELAVYTKYIRILQKKLNRRIKILILGSTPEFRDWAFEENMEVTVMDYSKEYHETISREIRHKYIIENENQEKFICKNWIELDSRDEYDVIIGDLVIGNITPNQLNDFLYKISLALKKDGLFLGKSFFVPKDYKVIKPEDLIKQYYSGHPYHPYSALSFDLTMYSIDENNLLSFKRQYNELVKLKTKGLIKDETMSYFENIGWDNEMKFQFYVPSIEEYEKLVKKYLKIFCVDYSNEIYADKFPLYIITNKNSEIFGGKI